MYSYKISRSINLVKGESVRPVLVEYVVASLSWIFLLALVVGLLVARPALSAENGEPDCSARDLVADLAVKNPREYKKLIAEGAKIRNSGYRFWKLEKPGQRPDWLLGTMHLSDPRVTNLPAMAKDAYDSADTVVLESDEILDPGKAAAALFAKPDLMMFSGNKSLSDFLKPEDAKVVEAELQNRGIPFGAVIKMKPYILLSMVALPKCELTRKAKGEMFLDMKLAVEAKKSGKTVLGVETLAEQIEAMASLPMDFHIQSLVAATRYPDFTRDMIETTLQLYLKGQIGLTVPASLYFAPEKNPQDAKAMAMFDDRLVRTRNHHMADRGEPILARGNVFMAVGALHLIGDEGLVELLRKKGYTATPVE